MTLVAWHRNHWAALMKRTCGAQELAWLAHDTDTGVHNPDDRVESNDQAEGSQQRSTNRLRRRFPDQDRYCSRSD